MKSQDNILTDVRELLGSFTGDALEVSQSTWHIQCCFWCTNMGPPPSDIEAGNLTKTISACDAPFMQPPIPTVITKQSKHHGFPIRPRLPLLTVRSNLPSSYCGVLTKRASTFDLPLPTARLASAALQALRVDKELSPLVRRSFSTISTASSHVSGDPSLVSSSKQTILRTEYKATTNRMLRVAVNGFMESLSVVLGVMEELDVDVLDMERPKK
jgi:EKC/KEOPS complex subunit PCC1/LAGE3